MQVAVRMVMQYGWGPDDNRTIYFSSNAVCTATLEVSFISYPSLVVCKANLRFEMSRASHFGCFCVLVCFMGSYIFCGSRYVYTSLLPNVVNPVFDHL